MKILKNYKEFNMIIESSVYDESDLDLDGIDIDDYYEQNAEFEEWHNPGMLSLEFLTSYIDDAALWRDIEEGYTEGQELDSFDEDEMKTYMKDNNFYDEVNAKWKEKMDELDKDDYDNKEDYEEDLDNLKDFTYSERIDDLEEDEIKEILEDEEREFYKHMFGKYYSSGLGYLEEMYGEFTTNRNPKYGDNSEETEKMKFDAIENYIDWGKVDADLVRDTDTETKEEFYRGQVLNDKTLQKEVFDNNIKNVIYLFDMIDSDSNFAKSYEFQKAFIDQTLEEEYEYMDDDEEKKEFKETELPEILLKINKKFGVDKTLTNEYSDYMHLINMDKYQI